jgi:hypothetical protein
MKKRIGLFSGCGFILIALLIMFVIPVDSLQHSGGRARLGAVFSLYTLGLVSTPRATFLRYLGLYLDTTCSANVRKETNHAAWIVALHLPRSITKP